MLSRKTGNVNFNRHGPDRGPEIEEAPTFRLDAEPVGQISGVCNGRRQPDDSQLVVGVGRDEVGPRDDDFENGATVLTQQVDFVDDYQSNSLEKRIHFEHIWKI